MRNVKVDLVDSGVPWLGRVPESWTIKPLWSMFERIKDIDHPEEQMLSVFREFGVVAKNSRENLNRTAENRSIYQLVHPGWLVANRMKAWQGSVGISTLRGIVSGHYICFAPRHNENGRYLDWLLRSTTYTNGYALLSRGVRIGQAEIDNNELRLLPILLPPIWEQLAIVEYLDRETGRIDTLIGEQQLLIEMLRERRAAEISAEFAKAALTPLRQVIKYAQTGPFGTQLSAAEYVDSGVPVINPTHIQRGLIVPDASITVTTEKAGTLGRFSLAIGDIVLGRKGEVDKSALVDGQSAGSICGSDSMALRPAAGTVPDYLWWFLQSAEAHNQLKFWSVGATVSGLNQTTIRNVRLPLPDEQEQKRIAKHLYAKTAITDTLIAETERFIELSKERRSALITAAITGQIDVQEMA
ncbi:restriction endonuclease subunit S [Rhodococcoides corynebacterioides]|uniref:restriction endonuclease subunit S n=1 Tax=Rhodococcoides corynebacterioides TaxID=53972 RepID=UPI003F7DF692